MIEEKDIIITVVIVTISLLALIVIFLFLIISNSNRKNRHKAEMAELQIKRDLEVLNAEREVTKTILNEIGSELHDNVGQLFTAVQISLMNRFKNELDHVAELAFIVSTLEEGVDEISRLGRTLNSDLWRDKSLFDAFSYEVKRLQRLNLLEVSLEFEEEIQLNIEERIILFRIFQEVISNSIKHGKASRVEVQVKIRPLSLTIADNGIGFDQQEVRSGAGLHNIHHRCQLINFKS